jgi:hypothetical protein
MSKRKAATKNDNTKPADAVAQREPLSIERSGCLAERAREEMDLWVSTLSRKDRASSKCRAATGDAVVATSSR